MDRSDDAPPSGYRCSSANCSDTGSWSLVQNNAFQRFWLLYWTVSSYQQNANVACQACQQAPESMIQGDQYSTEMRNSPRAGTVGPAGSVQPGCNRSSSPARSTLPFPISSSTPTMFRTMCFKNPLPVTR